jgi:hypothetical protein
MAGWSHQSRNAKALRCRQSNGLAGITYSFMMPTITPVNITYARELTNFSSAGARGRAPVCAQADAEFGLQPGLSTA